MLENGPELLRVDGHDDPLAPVQVGERLQLLDDVDPRRQWGRDHGTDSGRVVGRGADRHEHQGRGTVQGHARHGTAHLRRPSSSRLIGG